MWGTLKVIGGTLALFYAWAWYRHRHVTRTGQLVQKQYKNGLKLTSLGGDYGTAFVYKEIFEDKVYFKHGITLENVAAPVVVDIGADIGFFTRFIVETFPKAVIFAAEPVPLLVNAIRRNIVGFEDRVHLHQVGIGSQGGTAKFDFDTSVSIGTSMCHDEVYKNAELHRVVAWTRAGLLDMIESGNLPEQPTRTICDLLNHPVLGYIVFILLIPVMIVLTVYNLAAPQTKFMVECPIRRLDEFLFDMCKADRSKLKRIDLMKIDVEGAEWAVIQSMSQETWDMVQQIVIEVHDIDGRIQKVKDLLKQKGFKHIVEDAEDWESHKLLKMSSLFARR